MKKKNKKPSPRRRWGLSMISYQLGSDVEHCKCSSLDWKNTYADWMMCPECGRIWVRKEPRNV